VIVVAEAGIGTLPPAGLGVHMRSVEPVGIDRCRRVVGVDDGVKFRRTGHGSTIEQIEDPGLAASDEAVGAGNHHGAGGGEIDIVYLEQLLRIVWAERAGIGERVLLTASAW
jgi:hypothetical protein